MKNGLDDADGDLESVCLPPQEIVSPDPGGAHNWNPIAFNPSTGLVYLAAKNGTHGLHVPDAQWKYDPKNANLTLTPRTFARTGPPTPAITMNVSPDVIHEGQILYTSNCAQCRGLSVVAGPLPDLRYSTRQVHEQFEAIVRGGARATLGMPPFKDLLKPDQVKAIQACALSRAKESASTPPK